MRSLISATSSAIRVRSFLFGVLLVAATAGQSVGQLNVSTIPRMVSYQGISGVEWRAVRRRGQLQVRDYMRIHEHGVVK